LKTFNEIDRLLLQASLWEDAAELLFDRIGVSSNWICCDYGCGPIGVLEQLAKRISPPGFAVGVDCNTDYLSKAENTLKSINIETVSFMKPEKLQHNRYRRTFDLTHERFVLPHVASPANIVQEMLYLTNKTGTIAFQELNLHNSFFDPQIEELKLLKRVISGLFISFGNQGFICDLHNYLRQEGVSEVETKECILKLEGSHPYFSHILAGILQSRSDIIREKIASIEELELLTKWLFSCDIPIWHGTLVLQQTFGKVV
jgi:ubiquinone/menaquinone biosynthesis C-methylase UbiE